MGSTLKVVHRESHRLSMEAYQELERQLPSPVITDDTSPQKVGYLLGVQAVLKKLREGFTLN
jgi:hypothetical protein